MKPSETIKPARTTPAAALRKPRGNMTKAEKKPLLMAALKAFSGSREASGWGGVHEGPEPDWLWRVRPTEFLTKFATLRKP